MFYRALCIFTVFHFAAVIAVADDKRANDSKSLQGTWQAVYAEANGEKSSDDQVKELQIVIKGDEIFTLKPEEGEGQKFRFKLDTDKTLNTIDLSAIDGPDKGKTIAGIYSLKGGELKLCLNIWGEDRSRPKEFKTHAGDGVVFATLERAKKK